MSSSRSCGVGQWRENFTREKCWSDLAFAVVSQQGILWVLDQHRLLCGDARNEGDLDRLVGSSRAAMAFLDVPYNVRVRSIGGRGRVKHAEFAFASGEMTPPEYVEFVEGALGNATRVSRDVPFTSCAATGGT